MTGKRLLLVVFDGLRPDMVTPELMPRLHALAESGCRFVNSRAAFPTETRVNQASLVTGCWPERHGIVGNTFRDPRSGLDRWISSGDDDDLLCLSGALDGELMDVPSLGELLGACGASFAVLGSGTPGGTRLLYHTAERAGGFRLSLYRPDRSCPAPDIERVLGRLGPIPDPAVPALERCTYLTDVYLRFVEPELAPDVCVLWYFEPDFVYHHAGVGTPKSLRAVRHVDAELGRIVDWWRGSDERERLQIITLSDHGHITCAGTLVDLVDELNRGGFEASRTFADRGDVIAHLSRLGGLALRGDVDEGRLIEWLQEQAWCGPVIARSEPAALRFDALRVDHRRTPEIVLVTRDVEGSNAQGYAGLARGGVDGPASGGGNHGGLHAKELHNWFAAAGSTFREQSRTEIPCGIVDVLPTCLRIMGIPIPGDVQGRVLDESLHEPAIRPMAPIHQSIVEVDDGGRLYRQQVGESWYLDRLT